MQHLYNVYICIKNSINFDIDNLLSLICQINDETEIYFLKKFLEKNFLSNSFSSLSRFMEQDQEHIYKEDLETNFEVNSDENNIEKEINEAIAQARCQYVSVRGHFRGQVCGRPAEPVSDFCKLCQLKSNALVRPPYPP